MFNGLPRQGHELGYLRFKKIMFIICHLVCQIYGYSLGIYQDQFQTICYAVAFKA